MRRYISSKRDVKVWAENVLDVDGEQAQAVADAVWGRADFPHPVNHTDLTEYLAGLGEDGLAAAANGEGEAMKTQTLAECCPETVWYASYGQPAGDRIEPNPDDQDEPLHLPGDCYGGDSSPWWDLSGQIAPDGRWEWDGRGDPRDYQGNTVTKIVAWRSVRQAR